jgi:predicted peptidase
MVDAVKRTGGNAQLTVYPEAQHDSWTETYNNPALYEWLLKQSK